MATYFLESARRGREQGSLGPFFCGSQLSEIKRRTSTCLLLPSAVQLSITEAPTGVLALLEEFGAGEKDTGEMPYIAEALI